MRTLVCTVVCTVLLAASCAAADKLIYRSASILRFMGGGFSTSAVGVGALIWDPATNEAHAVGGTRINGAKLLVVRELKGYQFVTVRGARGREDTIIAKAESPASDLPNALSEAVYARGRNWTLAIGGKLYTAPRTMAFTTRGIVQPLAPASELQSVEATGRYSIDLRASLASNASLESVAQAVERYRQQFIAAGYAEIQQP